MLSMFRSAACCLLLSIQCLTLARAGLLRTSCINNDCSAVRISIDNPPITLFNAHLISAFNILLKTLERNQTNTKVVVVSSAVEGFFGSHLDLNLLGPANNNPSVNGAAVIDQYYDNIGLLISIPIIFIAEINGRAWGCGDEHLLRMDMRFAGPDAQFSAPEAALGVIHVGGLQQLVQLIGPGRAAEYMLSSAEVDAEEAARIGWVNRSFRTETALRDHVDRLAQRIALCHPETLKATKQSIAEQSPIAEMLARDRERFRILAELPFVASNVQRILELSRHQSRWWELDISDNIVEELY